MATQNLPIENYEPTARLAEGIYTEKAIRSGHVPVAVNATATLTAAQVLTGYITTTSLAGVTMTMPTGTLLGAACNAKQGVCFDFYIDNTAGSNTVTVAASTNAILGDLGVNIAAGTTPSVNTLTIANGTTGLGRFTVMFSSATAYTFTRSA